MPLVPSEYAVYTISWELPKIDIPLKMIYKISDLILDKNIILFEKDIKWDLLKLVAEDNKVIFVDDPSKTKHKEECNLLNNIKSYLENNPWIDPKEIRLIYFFVN